MILQLHVETRNEHDIHTALFANERHVRGWPSHSVFCTELEYNTVHFQLSLYKLFFMYLLMDIAVKYRGADKTLARPGRIQATATKL